MSRLTEILIHLGFWLIMVALSFLGVITSNSSEMLPYAWRNLMGLIYMIPLFYLFYSFLIPRHLAQKKTAGFILLSISSILISGIVIGLVDKPMRLASGLEGWADSFIKEIGGGILAAIYISVLATLVRFVIDWFRNQKTRLELINRTQASELALMKSQINPHFLFNTLNNIYSLVNSHDDKALDAMDKLSGIMRYLIYDAQSDFVMLSKEITYLQSYIELQRLRVKDPDSVEYSINGYIGNLKIAPMLLIPLVENAFKHGDRKALKPNIVIKLEISGNKLTFNVCNVIPRQAIEKDNSTGIGLANLKKRLDIISLLSD
ncbi:MAG: sensor histidine kinase [Bacteroidales bacterium]|nr:sensor histidine kinase [Bacteroidales bacterium]